MYTLIYRLLLCVMFFLLLFTVNKSTAAEHNHQAMVSKVVQTENCKEIEVTCAKTVTSVFAPNDDLWRLWAQNTSMYFQISIDNGLTFSDVNRVAIDKEKISARNENRPKIAFDKYQGVYLSWATPKEKKHTADVRFSYSSDYGKTFTKPITVNDDNLLTGHSFNEMLVTDEGDINIVWLDSRLSHQLRLQGKKTKGSELYIGKANYRKNETSFSNKQLANNTCVCCRIAMDYNNHGELAIFWRHIYGDNIREFALLTLSKGENSQQTPYQISYDHWKINGCPHQGGAISINENNRYHMVWFNQGDVGKGIFYASSTDQGKSLTKPISVGVQSAQAAHPHLNTNSNNIDIVWTQFTGTEHELWHQRSTDNGKSFTQAVMLATAVNGSDRPFIFKKDKVSYVSWHRPKQGHLVQAL
ncbi:sialidase family protein [Candidatus Colwellia aromaticivorans]|uniref:sialidase family protein n=1 Tax=Candidatus Colwellia aromaticivorans TaxID=2267621 RepID=UPI000DF3EAC0|nr:sialidase family protein [Candidatus Colwellia aromaticivorans]